MEGEWTTGTPIYKQRGAATSRLYSVIVVIIKEECDSNGSDTVQDLNVRYIQSRQDSIIDTKMDITQRDIKNEDGIYKVMIKEELDIGPSVLQSRASPHPYWLPLEAHDPAPHFANDSGNKAMLEPLDTMTVQTVSRAKEEDHYSKDSCKELAPSNSSLVLDANTTDNVTERVWKKKVAKGIHCVKLLTECDFTTNTTNIKRDTNSDVNKYEGDYCGYKTNSKTGFQEHKCLHKPKNPSTSQQNEYSDPQSDTGHYTTVKPYKCSQCEYSASYLYILQRHMRTHTGEKPYKCKQCNYSASQIGTLHTHMRRHTGEKPYKCMYCEYSAARLSSVQTHMRRHTGEKPYRCDQCEYSASQLKSLQMHMRRHTGEKPYRCEQCEYKASDRNRLQRHMRRHTGEKPYTCVQCEYSTSDVASELRLNCRLVYSIKICPFCVRFLTKSKAAQLKQNTTTRPFRRGSLVNRLVKAREGRGINGFQARVGTYPRVSDVKTYDASAQNFIGTREYLWFPIMIEERLTAPLFTFYGAHFGDPCFIQL
ncbi:Zinc finger protein 569 [Eumeta japonica]|uniref:Zinc finger protein 569 n=1 Tax=Eumeta variegata TaxID=151549 RepID=A0A4C1TD86_EUMVA|nr:Zinc finger protein 569 [Eumeta japonica]